MDDEEERYVSLLDHSDGVSSVLAIGNVQSGKTRFMINETKNALDNDYDMVILLGGSNNLLLKQSYYRFVKDLKTTGYPVHDIKGGALERVSKKYKGIVISLKHSLSIDKLILTTNSLSDKKILIFDDESDFGGINIGKGKGSETFLKLRELYNSLNQGKYVSVTATPFADILSKDGFNFKQIIKLKPGEGYKGIREFNESNVYVEIKEYHELLQGRNSNKLLEILVDHIKRVIKVGNANSQLLINPSLDSKVHRLFMSSLTKIFIVLKNPAILDMYFSFKEIKQAIKIIDELENNVYLLDRNHHDWNSSGHSIVVGGALISRGYTFEELLTCVLLNTPAKKIGCDTLLQRARWFGYRKNMQHMKIYLPLKIIESYKEAEILNDFIFNSIDKQEILEKINEHEWEHILPSGKAQNGS